jgi:hypothetical protein
MTAEWINTGIGLLGWAAAICTPARFRERHAPLPPTNAGPDSILAATAASATMMGITLREHANEMISRARCVGSGMVLTREIPMICTGMQFTLRLMLDTSQLPAAREVEAHRDQ